MTMSLKYRQTPVPKLQTTNRQPDNNDKKYWFMRLPATACSLKRTKLDPLFPNFLALSAKGTV